MLEQLAARVRQLAPAHQEDVWKVLTGTCTLKDRFLRMNESERSTKLDDFERYAGWTLPTVFPPENITGAEDVQYDYQSLGAQLVENLTSKIVLALFHPSRPFFKGELPAGYNGMATQAVEAEMSKYEKEALKKFAEVEGRTVVTDVIQSLIVTGNACLHTQGDDNYRWFSYRDYNATFDSYNKLVECIIRETVELSTLEADVAREAMAQGRQKGDFVTIYTGILRLTDDWYLVWQEIEDIKILAHRYGVYDTETLPYKPQRWKVMPGRQAGIGVVENMSGDFHTLSSLAETDIDIMALITDIKTLVNPMGQTKMEHLIGTAPGAVCAGREEDIHSHSHEVDKQAAIVDTKTQQLTRRLAQVFLMTAGVVRDAERVTAEEIRELTTELKQQHVGAFSRLAPSLQRPIALDLLRRVNPALKGIKVSIVTGLESVSRLADLENVRGFLADIAAIGQLPPQVSIWLNMKNIQDKMAAGWGVAGDDLILTEEEKQAEEQRQMQMLAQAQAAQSIGQQAGTPNG